MTRLLITLIAICALGYAQILGPIVNSKPPEAGGGTVTFDATAATGTALGSVTSASFDLVIVGSTNIGVVVGVAESVNNSGTLTVTVGGTAASLVSGTDSSTNRTYRTRIYCVALGSTTGTRSVSVSGMTANYAVIGAVSFTNVNQSTPCTGSETDGVTGAGAEAVSLAVSSETNNGIVWIGTSTSGGALVTPTQTQRWNVVNSFNQGAAGQSAAGAASVSGGWTVDAYKSWTISAVNVGHS